MAGQGELFCRRQDPHDGVRAIDTEPGGKYHSNCFGDLAAVATLVLNRVEMALKFAVWATICDKHRISLG